MHTGFFAKLAGVCVCMGGGGIRVKGYGPGNGEPGGYYSGYGPGILTWLCTFCLFRPLICASPSSIGDFGITRLLERTDDMASTFTGTPNYMSPEVVQHEGYDSKSDIW